MDNKFLSRKFLLTVVIIGLAFILVLYNKLTVDQWLVLVIPTMGFYTAGNIADTAKTLENKDTPKKDETSLG